jgi:hypothetical protein
LITNFNLHTMTERKIKRVPLTIDILFEDGITPEQQKQVARNVIAALESQANTAGLAPEDSETITKEIRVMIPGQILLAGKFEFNGMELKEEIL